MGKLIDFNHVKTETVVWTDTNTKQVQTESKSASYTGDTDYIKKKENGEGIARWQAETANEGLGEHEYRPHTYLLVNEKGDGNASLGKAKLLVCASSRLRASPSPPRRGLRLTRCAHWPGSR